MNIGNDIIRAYLQGVSQRRRKEEFEVESKLKQDQFEELKRRTQEESDMRKAAFQAEEAARAFSQKLQTAQARSALMRTQAETGLPAGSEFTETPQFDSQTSVDRFNAGLPVGTNRTSNVPGVGDITTPDPVTYAIQQAERASILQKPKLQAQMAVEGRKHSNRLAEIGLKGAIDKEADVLKREHEIILEGKRAAAALERTKESARGTITAAGIRAGATRDAANISASKKPKLTPTEERKKRANVEILKAYQDLYENLETSGKDIFKSTVGGIAIPFSGDAKKLKESSTSPSNDPQDAARRFYRSKLGAIDAERLSRLYGAVLSKGELDRAAAFVPDPTRDTPATAKAKLLSAIETLSGELRNFEDKTPGDDPTVFRSPFADLKDPNKPLKWNKAKGDFE